MAFFQAEDLRIVSGLADDAGTVEDALERLPAKGVAQIGIESDVDAGLGPAGCAAGAVEQNDVFVEVGVVVDRWTPMRIRIFIVPRARGGEDGAEPATEAGFGPLAEVKLIHFTLWGEAVFKGHAGGCYALRGNSAGVVGEEEIKKIAFAVEDDACVAVTAGEEAVFGVAIAGIAGFENNTEILDGGSVVARDCGTDLGSGEAVAGAAEFRFVVVEEEERAVCIAPDRFKPDRAVFGGIESDFAGCAEIGLIGAAADVWDASGMEEVHDACGPECGAVAVDNRGEFDPGREGERGRLGKGS